MLFLSLKVLVAIWAKEEAAKKKKQDFSRVEFLTYDEGLCVQCMHLVLMMMNQ